MQNEARDGSVVKGK